MIKCALLNLGRRRVLSNANYEMVSGAQQMTDYIYKGILIGVDSRGQHGHAPPNN